MKQPFDFQAAGYTRVPELDKCKSKAYITNNNRIIYIDEDVVPISLGEVSPDNILKITRFIDERPTTQ